MSVPKWLVYKLLNSVYNSLLSVITYPPYYTDIPDTLYQWPNSIQQHLTEKE